MDNLFFNNRRLLILLIALITVAGSSSFALLPRLEDPVLTQRAAIINTFLPGADAERVEALVTEKLEEELLEIEEIKEMRSTSRPGVSTISLELRDETVEVDAIWSRIRDRLADAQVELPPGASRPDFEEAEVQAYAYIGAITWDMPHRDASYAILRRWAERLEDRLRRIPGTRETELFGEPQEEFLVELDPQALVTRGLTFQQVAEQLRASDAKVSSGSLDGPQGKLLIEVSGELDSQQRIEETPIQVVADGSQVVRVRDVATVRRAIKEPASSLAIVDGQRAVVVGVLLRDDHRIDYWHDRAMDSLAEFSSELPGGLQFVEVFSQNQYVTQRLQRLLSNLVLGVLAVVVVVLLMMGWRSAVVVGISLPLSAFMVLSGMRALGIPIHQMSVTGLIIALGLLIDNAIVVVDEVRDRLSTGSAASEAVSKSVRHLVIPLAGSTLTTALAFAPIALMPGPAGEFVGAIAISVILAIFSSLLLSMTVIPAIAAMLQSGVERGHSLKFWRQGLRSERITLLYRRTLQLVFRHPIIGVSIGCVLPILGFVQSRHLPEQFFPPADRNQIQIELEGSPQTSLEATTRLAEKVRQIAAEDDSVENVHWFLGETAPSFYYNIIPRRRESSQYAHALVQLCDEADTRRVIHRLQAALDRQVPSSRVLVRQLEQGPPFAAPIEVRVFGPDRERLQELGDLVRRELVSLDDVLHVRSEFSEPLLKLAVDVDETAARLSGIRRESLAAQLQATYDGVVGGSVLESTEELPVRVRIRGDQRPDIRTLRALDLLPTEITAATSGTAFVSTSGEYSGIPLTAVAELKLTAEPAAIPHFNARRMNEVQAFIPAGVLPATVQAAFQQRLDSAEWSLPPGYHIEFGGEAEKRDDAVGNLMASVGILAVIMVATLVLSFSSFRMAAVILTVGGLSVGLGLGALYLFGHPFGFMAIVGTMGLAGVAINDSIVVLAAIRENDAARDGDVDAIANVVVRATRHVVATSLTTMAGFFPLILAGGGFWPPLAVAIAGGVAGATLLALYFVPAAYRFLMCPRLQEVLT